MGHVYYQSQHSSVYIVFIALMTSGTLKGSKLPNLVHLQISSTPTCMNFLS